MHRSGRRNEAEQRVHAFTPFESAAPEEPQGLRMIRRKLKRLATALFHERQVAGFETFRGFVQRVR